MIKKVFIIGMMGVGKTSVGFNLSNECGIKFIDTDDCLDINSLINHSSNNKFRHQEYEEILRCSKLNQKLIISTGGGSVTNQKNRDIISTFFCIYLYASSNEIIKRLKREDKFRPLIQSNPKSAINNDLFKKIYDDRIKYYKNLSNLTVNTDKLSLNDTVKFIKNELIKHEFIN